MKDGIICMGAGVALMVEWYIKEGSLSLTSNLVFSLLNLSIDKKYILIRSGHNLNIKNTRFFCTRFDHEGTRVKQFSDLSAHMMVLSSCTGSIRLSLA